MTNRTEPMPTWKDLTPEILESLTREECVALLVGMDEQGVWSDGDLRANGEEPLTLDEAREAIRDLRFGEEG